jgi:hypothetical protein
MSDVKVLSRYEAVEAIEQALGNKEDTAHVVEWTNDLWETIDELYKRLPRELVQKIIHAYTPISDGEAVNHVS